MSGMKMQLRLAIRNLIRNYRRSLTIMITVAVGTGSLFIFDGFNTGIMNQYRENTIHARYGYGQVNTAGYREQVFEEPWDHWITDPESLIQRIRTIDGVTHVFPRIDFYGLLTNGKVTLSGRGQGIDGVAESEFFNMLSIEQGQTLTDQPDGVVLGVGLANSLNAKLGDRITVLANTVFGSMNGVDLNVVGIFHTGAKEFDDVVFRLPLKAVQTLLDTPKVETISLGLRHLDDWDRVSDLIAIPGSGLEAVPFAVLDKVYYQHAVDWLAYQFGFIKLIILVIVILGIFNTVFTGVLERKQEVGNLRANGESKGRIISLFMGEGVLLGLGGALLGLTVSVLINLLFLSKGILMPPAPGITKQFHVLVELQPWGGVETFLLGVLCAALGTLLAAYRVAKIPIGEALRAT